MIRTLKALDASVWEKYIFMREPLRHRISPGQIREFAESARECGRCAADAVRSNSQGLTIRDIALRNGAKIRVKSKGEANAFAFFSEPDEITLYTDRYAEVTRYIEEKDLGPLLGGLNVEEAALAHEYFHMYECMHPDIYTNQRVLHLWRLWKIRNDARVSVLHEIGAMAFVKAFFGLDYEPYVLETLMVYMSNQEMGEKFYRKIMALAQAS